VTQSIRAAMNKTVCLDASVLLESILRGRRNASKAQQYIGSHDVMISPLTARLFIYFGQKDGLSLDLLLDLLLKHRFTDFGTVEILWAAKNHQGKDFEDALQIACALTSHCKEFVTFDKDMAKKYKKFITVTLL